MATMNEQEILTAARIFADEFKKQTIFSGIGGGSSQGSSSSTRIQTQREEKQHLKNLKEENDALRKHTDALKKSSAFNLQSAKASVGKLIGKLFSFQTVLTGLVATSGIEGLLNDYKTSLKYGVQASEGLKRAHDAAMNFAMQLDEFNQLEYTIRQTTMSLGGYTRTVELLKNLQSDAFKLTGDNAEALKYNTKQLSMFANLAGFSAKEINLSFSDMTKKINKNTSALKAWGILAPEQLELMEDLLDTEAYRIKLSGKLTKQERLAVLTGIKNRMEESKILGMTNEQMKKTAKSLADLSGESVMTRLDKAIEAATAMQYAGMGKKSSAVYQAILHGDVENIQGVLNQFADTVRSGIADNKDNLGIQQRFYDAMETMGKAVDIKDFGTEVRKAQRTTAELIESAGKGELGETNQLMTETVRKTDLVIRNLEGARNILGLIKTSIFSSTSILGGISDVLSEQFGTDETGSIASSIADYFIQQDKHRAADPRPKSGGHALRNWEAREAAREKQANEYRSIAKSRTQWQEQLLSAQESGNKQIVSNAIKQLKVFDERQKEIKEALMGNHFYDDLVREEVRKRQKKETTDQLRATQEITKATKQASKDQIIDRNKINKCHQKNASSIAATRSAVYNASNYAFGAAAGGGKVRGNVARIKPVNGGIPQEARALLATIAGKEARSYNEMYGGSTFSDFSRHPNIPHRIRKGVNAGKSSTAAGLYQFLIGTWKEQANKLGLKDFSPKSQDAAAWNLAQEEFKRDTGMDLLTILQSGNPEQLAKVAASLNNVWTSMPSGIEQGRGNNLSRFLSDYRSNLDDINENEKSAAAGRDLLKANQPGGGVVGDMAMLHNAAVSTSGTQSMERLIDISIASLEEQRSSARNLEKIVRSKSEESGMGNSMAANSMG